MLFILNVWLSWKASQKGWGARVLIPWGVELVVAFVAGFGLAASGLDASDSALMVIGVVLDIALAITFVVMLKNPLVQPELTTPDAYDRRMPDVHGRDLAPAGRSGEAQTQVR